MKRLFFLWLAGGTYSLYGQNPNLLLNGSFEQLKPGEVYQSSCLPINSGGYNVVVPNQMIDYFNAVRYWGSDYSSDPKECNPYGSFISYSDQATHSPDWLGGAIPCLDAWDGNCMTGFGAYELFSQELPQRLTNGKCYEFRIKAKFPYTYFALPSEYFTSYRDHKMDVILSNYSLFYKKKELDFSTGTDAWGNPICAHCVPEYRSYYWPGPPVDNRTLFSFDLLPLYYLYQYNNNANNTIYNNYAYKDFFEFHGIVDIDNVVIDLNAGDGNYLTVDLRDPINGSCNSVYMRVDWLEFYESCPDHFDIEAAIIAGNQGTYTASNYVRSGNLGRGNAIIANNGKTNFYAGKYIEITPGFYSDLGSVVEMLPGQTCTDCSRRNLSTDIPSVLPHNEENVSLWDKQNSGNSESVLDNDLLLGPNPTHEICTLQLRHGTIQQITVIDSKGQSLMQASGIESPNYQLSVESLSSGVYYLVVETSEGILYKKLIKL